MKRVFIFSFIIPFNTVVFAQSNWKIDSTHSYSYNDSTNIWRKGNVAVSHIFQSAFNNKFLVTDKYRDSDNRTFYVSLNEPLGDSTLVGLAENPAEAHNTFVANHYLNFKTGVYFPDVHTSTSEINLFRGVKDVAGFRDGGHLAKGSALKISGTFGNNGRSYRNTEFDLVNLRFFTDNQSGNQAIIDNFYALRMEDFRGVNTSIIQNGWGIFIKPNMLNNYFGGKLGLGTTNVTHKLTIEASSNPLKITGLEIEAEPDQVLSVNAAGEVKKTQLSDFKHTFLITTGSIVLSDDYEIYVHKGGDAIYTLPAANLRIGKIWKITNMGSGTLTLIPGFYDGNELRTSILNKPGASSFEIFSDGIDYVSVK